MIRRRSAMVGVGAVGLTAAAVAAMLHEPDYDHAAVCVDEATQQRIDDERCDDDHHSGGYYGGRGWYYIPRGSTAPSVGSTAAGGSTSVPAVGQSYGSGFDPEGGVVTRGGFGHGFGSFGG